MHGYNYLKSAKILELFNRLSNVMKVNGITLIELIVVIAILGILSVTAAPRLLHYQDGTNEAIVFSLKGAMVSALTLFNTRWVLDGEPNPNNAMRGGWGYKIYDLHYNQYGYPRIINKIQQCDVIMKRLIDNPSFDDYSYVVVGVDTGVKVGNQCVYTFTKVAYEMRYTETTGEVTLAKKL